MTKKERLKQPMKVEFPDFDSTEVEISSSGISSKEDYEKQKETIFVSVKVLCGSVVKDNGLDELLKKEFPKNYTAAKSGFTATLKMEIDELNDNDFSKELEKIACLRRYVLIPPIVKAMSTFTSGGSQAPLCIPYREEENIYTIVADKSLVIIFSIRFQDADDITLAHVFFNGFKDAKRDTSLGNAPSVSFTEGRKPLELKNFKGCKEPNNPEELKNYCFVAFSIREEHCSPKLRNNTLDLLLSFRNYLEYHLKCSKAYMHYKMRKRCTTLLEALEDARDKTGIKKVRKTFSGKTFTQK